MNITYDSATLTSLGFGARSFNRDSGALRNRGIEVPGRSGIVSEITPPEDRDIVTLTISGQAKQSDIVPLRTHILGDSTYRTLVFSDLSPKYYMARGVGVYESQEWSVGIYRDVEIAFLAQPYLLDTSVTDTTSPVTNAGDTSTPGVWTVTAAGSFILTVGSQVARWTGGAGAVVIDSETCRCTLDGAEAPQYHEGGFPWLAPGANTVTCSPGFSVAFNPRYL